jgi:hypothetical protein
VFIRSTTAENINMARAQETNENILKNDPTAKENILGVIPNTFRWTRWGGKDWFDIVVTEKRLVFVRLNDPVIYPGDYTDKVAAEVLAANKKNFAITFDQFKSFKWVPGHGINHLCNKYEEIQGELTIKTPDKKHSFYVPVRQTRNATVLFTRLNLYKPESQSEGYMVG